MPLSIIIQIVGDVFAANDVRPGGGCNYFCMERSDKSLDLSQVGIFVRVTGDLRFEIGNLKFEIGRASALLIG
jgi:hypothetical protein